MLSKDRVCLHTESVDIKFMKTKQMQNAKLPKKHKPPFLGLQNVQRTLSQSFKPEKKLLLSVQDFCRYDTTYTASDIQQSGVWQ